MADMLVRLYDLPDPQPLRERLESQGVSVRRAHAFEMQQVVAWIGEHFGTRWASEAAVCFSRQPISCHIALDAGAIVGFACHEATQRGFFGPTGVHRGMRGRGIGAVLLKAALQAMRELGYAYAIIGGVGPADFYRRHAKAIDIPGSTPGIYGNALPPP